MFGKVNMKMEWKEENGKLLLKILKKINKDSKLCTQFNSFLSGSGNFNVNGNKDGTWVDIDEKSFNL